MKRIAVLATALMVLALSGCGNGKEEARVSAERPEITGVRLEPAALTEVEVITESSGTVKARNTSMVSGRMMGAVVAVHVKAGDRVASGQLLAEIDNREMTQKVAQARAGHRQAVKGLAAAKENMHLAEITYDRYHALFVEKALAQQELDQMATAKRVAVLEYERVLEMVARAAAGVREAEVGLGFTRVIAPVAGLVTARMIDPGSMALPGVPLFTIEDTSLFRIETDVAEIQAGKIVPGMAVRISIPEQDQELSGTVSEVVSAIDPRSRTFPVKIKVDGTDLKSGRFVRVRIPVATRKTLLLPAAAVVEKGQLTGVYVVNDNQVVTYRLIRIGRRYGDQLEILAGVKPGERIIVDGLPGVTDGGILREDNSHE
ncbi:MAG: efflux RND transporter periplasmic adaptor subunit [Desulfobacterales bacterium]|nr:efflux RND transporter periplasmic adaptor subunit [Desulfobacterales bacterium]